MQKSLYFIQMVILVWLVSIPASATIHNVDVGNFFFSPTKTIVNPGDTVRWTLASGIHTTTSDVSSPKAWDSGNMTTIGQSYDVVFQVSDGPGPFPYHCGVHPFTMKDTIFMASVAEPTVFTFLIDEAQANAGSGTGSFASGYGIATLNSDSTQLSFEIHHDVANATDVHVHLGAPGVNGGIKFAFSSSTSPIMETWSLSAGDVTDLFAGNLYVNIHSTDVPAGEIRGQVVQSSLIYAFNLTEAEANGGAGTGSSATGFGVLELSADQSELSIYCEHNVANVTDGHIHLGAQGVSGAIQFGFSSAVSPISETWMLTADDVNNLLNNELYINIHSSAFPAGEIRGQIDLDPTAITFDLDEAQANGCDGTGSSAVGNSTVNLKPGGKELTVTATHDVANVTDGHIHLGLVCVSGGIQFGFTSAVSPINEIWYLTKPDVINFFQRELYINIHSMAFPAGEIRGQLSDIVFSPSCCIGIRGNIDGSPETPPDDPGIDIADLVYFVDFSFSQPPGPPPVCNDGTEQNPYYAEADVNGDSSVDIGDIVYMVDFMFSQPPGPAPVDCSFFQ